jgi:uncharacterized repeat protein (TIGR01451 family)
VKHRRAAKRLPIIVVTLVLLAASITTVIAETVSSSKVAASGGSCQTGSVYLLGSGGNIYQINTSSGARTYLGSLASSAGFNALGITSDGAHAYAMVSSGSGASTVYEFNTADGTTAHFAGPTVSGSYSFVMGALDPASGIFYIATYSSVGVDLYGFDTASNTAISGRVAQVHLPAGGAGGDMVFDSTGHLYLASAGSLNALLRVDAPIPATGADAQLTASTLAPLTVSSPNGITFDGDGYLYVSSSNQLSKVNPNSGVQASTVAIGAVSPSDSTVDLADCQYNGELQLQANLNGRYSSTDQFALSITGGGIASGNTATTSGASAGLQTATAGPIAALGGTTYEIHESAVAPTSLANYTLSASCVDTADSNAPVPLTPLTPGSTTDYSIVFPNATTSNAVVVACTFIDSAADPPTISLSKVLAAPRRADTDQFSVAIRTGGPSGPVVSSTANATTTGTGATVSAGTGATGAFTAAGATTYYLTEAAAGTTALGDYLATISCTDSANLQSGLPTGAAFSGSLAITPVNGAQIACVLSNGVQSYSVGEKADAAIARPGDVITYTVTVANTGSYSYPAGAASFAIDLAGQLDDGAVVAASVVAGTGSAFVAGSELTWSGPLPSAGVGSTVTITYQVKISPSDAGDHLLTNTLEATAAGGGCPLAGTCATSVAVESYSAALATDTTTVTPGGFVAYTVTITNNGQVGYSAGAASVRIDLSGVSDDATYVPHSTTATAGSVQLSSAAVLWSGALPVAPAAGSTVTLQFRMQARAASSSAHGDGELRSSLTVLGAGGDCTAGCAATVALQQFSVSVLADASTVLPGQVISYTVMTENTGQVPYSSASWNDDLAGLLDDATFVAGSITATAGTTALVSGGLSWTGPLPVAPAPGATVIVTFSLRVNDPLTGDHELHNDITPAGPGAISPTNRDGGPPTGLKSFTVTPQITATGVGQGNVAAVSFTVTNTGTAPYPADAPAVFSVALGGALAGAKIDTNGMPGASGGANLLSWQGPLAVGASVPVTFTLILGPGDGDPQLLAAIVTAPGSGGGCLGIATTGACGAPTLMVSGAVAAEMIAAATSSLAFTGSDLRGEVGLGAIALLAGLELQLLAVAYAGRRARNGGRAHA